MKRSSIYRKSLIGLSLGAILSGCGTKKTETTPNIIYILADDLGYGELGCYGQEKIETPNIDALAENGLRFTQFYSGSPVCAPSRCMLLTGLHSGHAYIRSNDELADRGPRDYLSVFKDPSLEGQRSMPANTVTIGRLLQDAGYKTGMVGKWGLGVPFSESTPNKQGFDYYYGYICQRQAHTHYPLHLYENENRVFLSNDTVAPHTKLDEGADPYLEESYEKFTLADYANDRMFDALTGFVNENSKNPFFLYWATPIPHVAIQAPKRWVDYYVKKFGDEEPYPGDNGYFPHRWPHAGFAAMISYLDEQVGLLVQQLKDLGIYENTLIMFTSDNGPTYNGGTDSPWFDSAGPFKSEYGRAKGFVREGGIRVPMIAHWPGKVKPGTETDHISAAYDVMATVCEVVEIQPVENTDGISFLPTLLGKKGQTEHEFLYWEFPSYQGQQAVRLGKWKGIRENIFRDSLRVKLYDLEEDIQELNDVSAQNPEVVKKIELIMKQEHTPAEVERFRIKQLGD
jgi:arylsulfatase A-like enzyme